MNNYFQGDIIRISGYKNDFIVVSKNILYKATDMLIACPLVEKASSSPLHIPAAGVMKKSKGIIVSEQMKCFDTTMRFCTKIDRLPDSLIVELSDIMQGFFEIDQVKPTKAD